MALIPVGTKGGAPYQPNPKPFSCVSANAVYIGDPIKLAGSASAAGLATVDILAATDDPIYGVVVGIVPTAYDSTPYKTTATTERILLVESDPNLIYAIKEDGLGDALAVTDVGSVIDLIGVGTGNANSGLSSALLNSDSAATGASKQLVIHGLHRDIDNTIGSSATIWEVYINEAQLAPANAGNGV